MLRVVFMGSPAFAVPALAALQQSHEVVLVVSQPDKPVGRGRKVARPAVAEFAAQHGLPTLQPKSARTPEFAATLRETGADVGIVVAYGKILPAEVLAAFPHGCLNIHASLLPAYRGAAPIQWSIINGEAETGVTIMRLDEGMDTGPMLMKRSLEIAPADTSGTLSERLAPLGAELMLEALSALEAGTLAETAQDHESATYAPMLKKEDGRVDFSRPARAVCDLIRGVDPWPAAQTVYQGNPVKLYSASVAAGDGQPGEIVAVEPEGITVACGEGAVLLAELQPAGKRRMAAVDFARGRGLGPGARFGDGD